MSDPAADNALKIFMRVVCQDIGDQLAERTFRSTFGLVLNGGLRLALGPFNYVLPVAEVISWLAQMTVRSYVFWSNQKAYGCVYSVQKDGDDVVVEVNRPDRLSELPIELPSSLVFPWLDLYQLNLSLPADRTLSKTAFQCGCCGRRILHGQGGHRPDCPLHEPRRLDPAVFATRRTLPPGGRPLPPDSGVTSRTCRDCGRHIDRVDDFEIGHAPTCRVNGLHRLTERTAPPRREPPRPPIQPPLRPSGGPPVWQCPACERIIQRLGDLETGHASWCPQRGATRLLGVGQLLDAAPASRRGAPQTRCRACGQTVISLRGREEGHGPGCPHNPDAPSLAAQRPGLG